jgi:hypothetical protein
MALSRKREKELKRLREAANILWADQREVLEHASIVAREASRQAGNLGREEVAPRVRDAIDNHVRPGIDSARAKLSHDLMPGVSSAMASALAVLELAKDPRVREVLSRASKAGSQIVSPPVAPVKNSGGPVRFILMGLGLVTAIGVAYAAWQTLRADDELWVSDEPEELPA